MGYTNLSSFGVAEIIPDLQRDFEDFNVVELGNQKLKNSKARRLIYNRFNISATPNSTKEWYLSLGFKSYVAIDLNTEKDAIAMDLNTILKDEYNYTDQFELVTNIGTGEHIFNQYAVFVNMHNLCAPNGYLFFHLPFYRCYNYNPNLFTALAHHNNYIIKYMWCSYNKVTDPNDIKIISPRNARHKGFRYELELDSFPDKLDPSLVVMMKKTTDGPFVIPIQDVYGGDNITEGSIMEKYK